MLNISISWNIDVFSTNILFLYVLLIQKFEELPNGLIDDLISVNIRSVYHLTQMVLPGISKLYNILWMKKINWCIFVDVLGMRERMRGAILCIGSGASELPSEPLYAGYVGTKAAIEGFCRSLQVSFS